MNTIKIQPATFNSAADISNYWKELHKIDMDYHLDEDLFEIFRSFSADLIAVICSNHDAL